ncbi:hypothetical protein [Nocardioides sp. REDSEA-S30_B4]|uniref:hypothetical protein n=1 Tax=Nocardioides sp. REDSEA-S30_B4 TaxID=1811552 RepID=UPI000B26AE50|nr:hypothetical protein [Nocardioides sp. REDSEA-S30_B4]
MNGPASDHRTSGPGGGVATLRAELVTAGADVVGQARSSAAAFFMGLVGVAGWALLSGLVCVALAALTLSRPRTTYAWAAASVALVVCLGKLWTTASNALLWANASA